MHIFLNFHWPAFLAIQLVFGIYWNNFIHSDICLRCQSNISEPVGLLLEWWIFDFYYIGYYSGSLCCMDTEYACERAPNAYWNRCKSFFKPHKRTEIPTAWCTFTFVWIQMFISFLKDYFNLLKSCSSFSSAPQDFIINHDILRWHVSTEAEQLVLHYQQKQLAWFAFH